MGNVQCSRGTPPQPAGGELALRTPAALSKRENRGKQGEMCVEWTIGTPTVSLTCGGVQDFGAVASMDSGAITASGRVAVKSWKWLPTCDGMSIRGGEKPLLLSAHAFAVSAAVDSELIVRLSAAHCDWDSELVAHNIATDRADNSANLPKKETSHRCATSSAPTSAGRGREGGWCVPRMGSAWRASWQWP